MLCTSERGQIAKSDIATNQNCTANATCRIIARVYILTISGMLRYPVEKTIALGGVATGNMNANEQDIVAEIIRKRGWIPTVKACKIYPLAFHIIMVYV